MIWIYILVATVISYLLCKKECKRPEYFILMLFPIELYGINIASVTVKPYMIFGAVVVFLYFCKKRSIYIKKITIVFTMLLFLSDFLTGLIMTSIMANIMLVLNLLIALHVLSYHDDGVDLQSLAEVAIATLIGHGVVFFVITLLFSVNPLFPDLLAYERAEPGVFIALTNGVVERSRMRGFTIDPNGFVVSYVFGGACALYYLLSKKGSLIKNIIALFLFVFIIIQSGSRMGLLGFAALVVLSLGYIIKVRAIDRNICIGIFLIIVAIMAYIAFNYNTVREFFDSYFNERASLSSDKGRLTIWASNMNFLIRTGKIWVGVGQGQTAQLGDLHTAFHNTWLEWIGACGIVIGGIISIWFLKIAVQALCRLPYYKNNHPTAIPIVLGYLTTVVCLSSISDTANITCVFWAILLQYYLLNTNHTEGINEFQGTDKKQSIAV